MCQENLVVWGRAHYLSVTEASYNIETLKVSVEDTDARQIIILVRLIVICIYRPSQTDHHLVKSEKPDQTHMFSIYFYEWLNPLHSLTPTLLLWNTSNFHLVNSENIYIHIGMAVLGI